KLRAYPSSTHFPYTTLFRSGDAVSLPEPIERAPVNAEKLGGQLLVPPGLSQDTADVMGDDLAQAQARVRGRAVSSGGAADLRGKDRKSTRLNSSHVAISYAV